MMKKRVCDQITWIDIESPTQEDVRKVVKEYDVHPLVAEELLSPTSRPRVDGYKKHIYLILHFPISPHPDKGKTEQEVDFVIGKDYIITAHYYQNQILEDFGKFFEANASITDDDRPLTCSNHTGYVFYRMLQKFYTDISYSVDIIEKHLENIEGHIFKGEEHEMVHSLSETSRKILDIRVATRPHKEVLEIFQHLATNFFEKEFVFYLNAIVAEYQKILTQLISARETLNELRDTNDSLLSTKTNDTMRFLTILAFVTFPLSLVASIFGMNTAYLPVVGHKYDFWIIIAGMSLATLAFFTFFKLKKWL